MKSFNGERMKDNLRILEWERELTEDELERINQIPQLQGFRGDMLVNEVGTHERGGEGDGEELQHETDEIRLYSYRSSCLFSTCSKVRISL